MTLVLSFRPVLNLAPKAKLFFNVNQWFFFLRILSFSFGHWFSTVSSFASQGTLEMSGDIVSCHNLGVGGVWGGGPCYRHLVGKGWDVVQHLTAHRAALHVNWSPHFIWSSLIRIWFFPIVLFIFIYLYTFLVSGVPPGCHSLSSHHASSLSS